MPIKWYNGTHLNTIARRERVTQIMLLLLLNRRRHPNHTTCVTINIHHRRPLKFLSHRFYSFFSFLLYFIIFPTTQAHKQDGHDQAKTNNSTDDATNDCSRIVSSTRWRDSGCCSGRTSAGLSWRCCGIGCYGSQSEHTQHRLEKGSNLPVFLRASSMFQVSSTVTFAYAQAGTEILAGISKG